VVLSTKENKILVNCFKHKITKKKKKKRKGIYIYLKNLVEGDYDKQKNEKTQ
jgi:hypothetical protein